MPIQGADECPMSYHRFQFSCSLEFCSWLIKRTLVWQKKLQIILTIGTKCNLSCTQRSFQESPSSPTLPSVFLLQEDCVDGCMSHKVSNYPQQQYKVWLSIKIKTRTLHMHNSYMLSSWLGLAFLSACFLSNSGPIVNVKSKLGPEIGFVMGWQSGELDQDN